MTINSNEIIKHYKPKFLARGGEHLVYVVDGHPDIVIKASTYKIKDSVLKITESETDYSDSCLETEASEEYSKEIKDCLLYTSPSPRD